MKYAASRCSLGAIVLCGWIALSQHAASDGTLWWRAEHGPVTKEECRALIKKVTGRPKVALAGQWYDVVPARLEQVFGQGPTADRAVWVTCVPEGTDFSEPAS